MLTRILPLIIAVLFFSVANAQKNTAASHYKAGINFKNDNKFPEALSEFNKAIALSKKNDSAYVQMGDIYRTANHIELAVFNYKKAYEINPRNAGALMGLGKYYRHATNNVDSALYFFSRASLIDVNSKEPYYEMAWAYNAKKDYDKAIANATRALQIDNNYKGAYQELGHAYNVTRRYEEAAAQFKKHLAISKVDLLLLYTGYTYIELKNKAAAMEQYEELLKINEKMAAGLKRKIDLMSGQN